VYFSGHILNQDMHHIVQRYLNFTSDKTHKTLVLCHVTMELSGFRSLWGSWPLSLSTPSGGSWYFHHFHLNYRRHC